MSLMGAFLRRANSLVNLTSFSFHRTFFHLRPLIFPSINCNNVSHPQLTSDTLSLHPQLPLVSQSCGFKVKLKLRKRCKDCYLVVRNERTYVICPTHPRHKQMSMVKKPKYTWKIAHACQSKVRPW